ncbi:hypothetical protein APHWI1_0756 [Anaplasma phagocytophilum str. ApWI1]|uniref:Uncharacterized protein n=1 Tax=Anaplasma phagocytophilum str. ApWI1 TaxID=1359155 RepID=A0A0F3PWG4_ANAPH|nr:hypothetical protein APHWI1_0756 [Anaplasma phagocytophilum str. ApWI1]
MCNMALLRQWLEFFVMNGAILRYRSNISVEMPCGQSA